MDWNHNYNVSIIWLRKLTCQTKHKLEMTDSYNCTNLNHNGIGSELRKPLSFQTVRFPLVLIFRCSNPVSIKNNVHERNNKYVEGCLWDSHPQKKLLKINPLGFGKYYAKAPNLWYLSFFIPQSKGYLVSYLLLLFIIFTVQWTDPPCLEFFDL